MKKLIVETKGAPIKNVAAILATWSKLAELVDQKVNLPKGCELVWELILQHVGFRGHVLKGIVPGGLKTKEMVDCWEAYSSVKMVFGVRLGGHGDEKQRADVPLTDVSQVMINDNGTFFWHSDMKKPEDDMETIELLATAVSVGKLPSGHCYECNWIPPFKVASKAQNSGISTR